MQLAQSKVVLRNVSLRCLAVRAKNWSEAADRFLQRCADAGNIDAAYILGMVCTTSPNSINIPPDHGSGYSPKIVGTAHTQLLFVWFRLGFTACVAAGQEHP
jgi:hypothetical protein